MPYGSGRIVRILGERVEVRVNPPAACGGCANRAGCAVFGTPERTVLAENPIGAGVGERVLLVTTGQAGSLSALAAFGLPAGLLLAGIVVGNLLAGDIGAGLGGGAGLGIGAAAVMWVNRHFRGRILPRVVRRLGDDEVSEQELTENCQQLPGGLSDEMVDGTRTGAGDGGRSRAAGEG